MTPGVQRAISPVSWLGLRRNPKDTSRHVSFPVWADDFDGQRWGGGCRAHLSQLPTPTISAFTGWAVRSVRVSASLTGGASTHKAAIQDVD